MIPENVSDTVRSLPPALRHFILASATLTAVALLVRAICANLLHLNVFPYNHYALPHDGDGVDLMNFYVRFQHFHSRGFFSPAFGSGYAYPAPVALLYWPFLQFRHAQIPFLLVTAGLMIWLAWKFAQALIARGLTQRAAVVFVALACICSYPFYFEFTRANMEIFMWLFSAAGVFALLKQRSWLGAALIGFAMSMKLYPFILLGLFVSRKRYREAVFSMATAVATTLISLWLCCPDIKYSSQQINAGVAQIQAKFVTMYKATYIGVDHSLFALIKRIGGDLPQPQYAHILHLYLYFCAFAGLMLYILRIRKLPTINQLVCLTVASILLPPVSFDYTLIHLYTPFVLWCLHLVRSHRAGKVVPAGTSAMLVCFIVLFSQIGEIIVHGERLNGQIKAITLLTMFVAALLYPVSSEFDFEGRTPIPAS